MRVAKALDKKPIGGPARELTLSSQDPFMDPEPELTVTVRGRRMRGGGNKERKKKCIVDKNSRA